MHYLCYCSSLFKNFDIAGTSPAGQTRQDESEKTSMKIRENNSKWIKEQADLKEINKTIVVQ